MSPIAKKKKRDVKVSRTDFSMLNYLEESINTYDTDDESEQKNDFPQILVNDFSTDISDDNSLDSDSSP